MTRTDSLADVANLAFYYHGGSPRIDETVGAHLVFCPTSSIYLLMLLVDKNSPERVQYSGCHEG